MKHPDPEIQALADETLALIKSGKMVPDRIEPWWEGRRENELTPEYLGRVLDEAGLPEMAADARMGHYDDYSAPAEVADGFELMRLVRDLRRAAGAGGDAERLGVIENAARRGEFDATKAESDRWAASKDGQDTFAKLAGSAVDLGRDAGVPTAGRNDPCPCGSGVKYKRCHGSPNPPEST